MTKTRESSVEVTFSSMGTADCSSETVVGSDPELCVIAKVPSA